MPSCQWCPCGDGEKYHILPLPLTTWSPISLSLCFIVCRRGRPLPLPLPSRARRGAPLSLSLSLSCGKVESISSLTSQRMDCNAFVSVVTGEKYHILPLPLTTWSPISLSLCFIACCRGSPPLPSRGALSLSLSCGFHNYGFEYMDSYPFKC